MSDQSNSHSASISEAEFWHLYFGRLLSGLHRQAGGSYRGTKIDHQSSDSMLGDLVDFSIPRQDLETYAYSEDERFDGQVSDVFAEALAAVLKCGEFDTPTVPNLARLSLVVQLLRNDLPSFPEENAHRPQARLRLLTHVLRRELSREEATARLGALAPERGKSFRAFCRAVLRGLQSRTLDLDQADHLLSDAAPSPKIVPWNELRELALETLDDCEIDIQAVCGCLHELLPSRTDYERMLASGRITETRTERDVLLQALARYQPSDKAIEEISRILDNSDNEDLFLLTEAVRALGLSNHKGAIEILIACLDRGEMERLWGDIEEALQRLCSGDSLIPTVAFGFEPESLTKEEIAALEDLDESEVRLERDYWRKIASDLPSSLQDWLSHDAHSVFWEKRLRCALNLELPYDLKRELQSDEVMQVRLASGAEV